jgi:hypothetical protein
MPILYVSGDPLLTQAQILAFGHNARGRAEMDAIHLALQQKYPAAFATYARRCAQNKLKTGTMWVWHEAKPALGFMIVRESPVGATRLRFFESVVLTLARDHALEGIKSVALVVSGAPFERAMLKEVLDRWLGKSALPVIVYEQYVKGVAADEKLND